MTRHDRAPVVVEDSLSRRGWRERGNWTIVRRRCYPVVTGRVGLILRQSEGIGGKVAARFAEGQDVWVDGRPARFCYLSSTGAAVVRYPDDTGTRVVPADKLATMPPPSEPRDE